MNDVRTVAELERTLKNTEPEVLQSATLAAIRTQGGRRRRARATAVVAGAAAAVVVASLGVAALTGGEAHQAPDGHVATPPSLSPTTLSPLARRALAEIPGAVQISSTRVTIPEPPGATSWAEPTPILEQFVASGPFDVGGAHAYQGVTMYDDGQFPAWLEKGTKEWDEREGQRDDSPGGVIGTTSSGVVVDQGEQQIACIYPPVIASTSYVDGLEVLHPKEPLEPDVDQPCMVSIVGHQGDDLVGHWTLAAPDFLAAGTGVQLYRDRSSAKGDPVSLWVGGTDGTDVASVDLELADGQTVEATVASGTLVPGETVFWATVPGELVRAVTRDADGDVIEDHPRRPCSGDLDCEVR